MTTQGQNINLNFVFLIPIMNILFDDHVLYCMFTRVETHPKVVSIIRSICLFPLREHFVASISSNY